MPTTRPEPSPLRILLVDDNADDRALAAREIGRDHPDAHFVEAASSDDFQAAIGTATAAVGEAPAAAAAGATFDIAVLDYALGWSTGIELFRRIRDAMPDCGVVMFTGTLGEEYAVEAMRAGLDDYIIKHPRRYPRLRASVTAILQQREERRARRRAEADRDILLKEVFHRVHNSLQTVIALLHLHANRAPDEASRRVFEELGQRMHALALVQGRLYRGQDYRTIQFDTYLDELAAAHAGLGGRDEIAVEVRPAKLRLPVDMAVPLALIGNELLSNALKHAFPNGRPGRVLVSLVVDHGAAEAELAVEDDGVGFEANRSVGGPGRGGGIGAQLVPGLARQIGGSFALEPARPGPGTRARVVFPLAPVSAG